MKYLCTASVIISLFLSFPVIQSEEPEWLQASRKNGKQGLVPANYLEII